MEGTPTPAERISVGRVVGETFSIYGQNLVALLGAAIGVFGLNDYGACARG